SGLAGVGQSRHERSPVGVAMHIREQLREGLRRDEVARREPRAVFERERGRVDLHGVGQEPALDVEPRLPRAFPLQLPAEDLEQHLREPVLTRVENRNWFAEMLLKIRSEEHTSE